MEILEIIYKLFVDINTSSPDLLMISRGQGRPSFSDVTCAAIAALKNIAKRSHTYMYARAIAIFFALLSRHRQRRKGSLSGFSSRILAALKTAAKGLHTKMYARAIGKIFALLSRHRWRQKYSEPVLVSRFQII